MIKKRFIFFLLGCAVAFSAAGVYKNTAITGGIEANASIGDTAKEAVEESDEASNTGTILTLNIGSVSKIYTVAAVMQLADCGKVDIDAPVTDYIPDFRLSDERYKKITVRMLMNHTSGLMGTVYGECARFGEADRSYHDNFLKRLETEPLKHEPGEFNCYCNDGFTLLEILVERVSGMTFTDYLEENICRPLSLNNTGTMWNMSPDGKAPVYVNGRIKLAVECEQIIGAGGIISTAADVCDFGAAFFPGNNVLLSEQSKTEMAKNNRTGECIEDFGLGWDAVKKSDYENAGVTVLSKGGDTFYQNASLVVAPDEKISVAVVSSGGGSGIDEEAALKLLDIALSEQGITVSHPEKEKPALSDEVPEKYLSYAGLYADTQRTVDISFPDSRYMLVTSVTDHNGFEVQYMYSLDGTFVKMSGDVASGKAIPADPLETVTFAEKDGLIFMEESGMGCILYKAPDKNTDKPVQNAWDKRNGVSYYLVNCCASSIDYSIENCCVTLTTSDDAKGYVNGQVMQDEYNACYEIVMPGTASRDLSNFRIEAVDGKEYLCLDEFNYRYISEENIPTFSRDMTEAALQSGEAKWFAIDGEKDLTLRLDIPEKAAVYVYDKYGNLKYSSYMTGYGNEVPLPEYGMIAFVGESGDSVKISTMG